MKKYVLVFLGAMLVSSCTTQSKTEDERIPAQVTGQVGVSESTCRGFTMTFGSRFKVNDKSYDLYMDKTCVNNVGVWSYGVMDKEGVITAIKGSEFPVEKLAIDEAIVQRLRCKSSKGDIKLMREYVIPHIDSDLNKARTNLKTLILANMPSCP